MVPFREVEFYRIARKNFFRLIVDQELIFPFFKKRILTVRCSIAFISNEISFSE